MDIRITCSESHKLYSPLVLKLSALLPVNSMQEVHDDPPANCQQGRPRLWIEDTKKEDRATKFTRPNTLLFYLAPNDNEGLLTFSRQSPYKYCTYRLGELETGRFSKVFNRTSAKASNTKRAPSRYLTKKQALNETVVRNRRVPVVQ